MVGTVEEAVDRLNADGESVKALAVGEMAPYPETEVREFIESVDQAMVVEMNSSAQFRGLTQKHLGEYGPKLSSLLKYNGNPFEPAEVVEGFHNTVSGEEATDHQTTFVPAAGD
jgi:pyruvate ferredoxin oxidoreductase alpha subunit